MPRLLESNYIRTEALGAVAACGGATKANYAWRQGICINTATGMPYPGGFSNQKNSACQCLYGPPPKGAAGVWSFVKGTFLGGGAPVGPQGQPTYTASSLVVPAVAVVGGVALLLMLRKKK